MCPEEYGFRQGKMEMSCWYHVTTIDKQGDRQQRVVGSEANNWREREVGGWRRNHYSSKLTPAQMTNPYHQENPVLKTG